MEQPPSGALPYEGSGAAARRTTTDASNSCDILVRTPGGHVLIDSMKHILESLHPAFQATNVSSPPTVAYDTPSVREKEDVEGEGAQHGEQLVAKQPKAKKRRKNLPSYTDHDLANQELHASLVPWMSRAIQDLRALWLKDRPTSWCPSLRRVSAMPDETVVEGADETVAQGANDTESDTTDLKAWLREYKEIFQSGNDAPARAVVSLEGEGSWTSSAGDGPVACLLMV